VVVDTNDITRTLYPMPPCCFPLDNHSLAVLKFDFRPLTTRKQTSTKKARGGPGHRIVCESEGTLRSSMNTPLPVRNTEDYFTPDKGVPGRKFHSSVSIER